MPAIAAATPLTKPSSWPAEEDITLTEAELLGLVLAPMEESLVAAALVASPLPLLVNMGVVTDREEVLVALLQAL